MRGLPKSVREQGTMADQLHEQYYGQPPADDDDTRDPDTTGGDAGQPDGAPDDQPPADAATDTTREDNADYWQRRFNTLQGKYNAEVTHVAAENRQLKKLIERAEQRATEAEQALETAQADKPLDLSEHFTPEEIEEYGESTLRMMLRAGKRATQADIDRVRQDAEAKVESVKAEQSETQQQQFMRELTAAVPDWESINPDPAFHRWLEQDSGRVDESGNPLTRQTLLERYEQAGNAAGVVELFNGYKQARQGEQRDQQARREAPPRASGGGAPPAPDDGPAAWTRDQIDAFYADYRRNMRRDPDGTRAREQELERALAAGKVT